MLENLKLMLDMKDDVSQDDRLNFILDSVKERLKMLLGGIEPPEAMNHIIVEVALIRFNRIGSEGITSHTVEGESASFGESDFNGFMDEIQAFIDSQKDVRKGRVRFL
ncbi:MAG: phage head-tail connector protein [Eubacteriales bacterium]|nr:phage head-tail connector protein [Eubacteriales bacterium]